MFTSKFLCKVISLAAVLMLTFGSVQPVYAAPTNDNFADALPLEGDLPISISVDNTGATFEADEPSPACGYGYSLDTVWYSYTPTTDVNLSGNFYNYLNLPVVAVYTGDSLNNLTPVDCKIAYDPLNFAATANTTYYFQVSSLWGEQGSVFFELYVTPPPDVWIFVDPWDPSTYDYTWFYAGMSDPVLVHGDSYEWTLWDGTIMTGESFGYQFAADGDYPVSVTFTTYDGRSATASTIVEVRTRDIAITKFKMPLVARTNQTKEIAVEITNKRSSEDVEVYLYKGLPGGDEQLVGDMTLYVPARAKRPVLFKFSYTFTATDAAIGKVTFRVEANIVNGRDALPMDNNAIKTIIVK